MKPDSICTALIGSIVLLLMMPIDGVAQADSASAAEISGYMDQAQSALRAQHPDVAVKAYQAVLKLDPNNIDARANLGVVAMSTGDWKNAAENLEEALKLEPSQSKVQALLGLCQAHLGRPIEAQKLLSVAFPKLEASKLKYESGLRLLSIDFENGELDKAAVLLATLQDRYPGDAAIAYPAFRVHSELAFQAIESLALNAPDSSLLHRALAEHLVNGGQTEAAITEYRKALAISPDSPDLHFELGQAIFFESHSDTSLTEAQKEFDTSLRLNPADARSECQLAEIELIRSNSAEAASHFTRALELNSGAACAKAGLAEQLMDKGNTQEALDYLLEAVRLDPYNDQFHYRLSAFYRRIGNKAEAAKEMEKFKQLREIKDDLQRELHPK